MLKPTSHLLVIGHYLEQEGTNVLPPALLTHIKRPIIMPALTVRNSIGGGGGLGGRVKCHTLQSRHDARPSVEGFLPLPSSDISLRFVWRQKVDCRLENRRTAPSLCVKICCVHNLRDGPRGNEIRFSEEEKKMFSANSSRAQIVLITLDIVKKSIGSNSSVLG